MTYQPKGGFISTSNSSTATLAGDAVFTGVGEDVSRFSSVSVSWNTDVTSANNGMSMEFSTDNSNWDKKIPAESHNDSLQVDHGGVHRLSVVAQYFRVVYTNGSGAQSTFRLQTLFHTDNSMPLISRIDQKLNDNSDCAVVRPVTNIDLDLARKQISGQRAFFFFGFNNLVGTGGSSVWSDIHPANGDINWQTAAQSIEVVSTDAADNGTTPGLGVRSVEVHGLSATGVDQSEIILTNGTSAVAGTKTYIRINKMHSEICGTYGGSHQGDITCQVAGGGDLLSKMTGEEGSVDTAVVYGSGEAGNGYWSVPLGKVMYITGLMILPDVATNKNVTVVLYEREDLLDASGDVAPRRAIWQAAKVERTHHHRFNSYIKIKGLTDVWFRAKASAVSKIQVLLDFYLVDANSDGE